MTALPDRRDRASRRVLLAAAACLAATTRADAFSLLYEPGAGLPETRLAEAARWNAGPDPFGLGTGLHDRIQVAIAPDFADALGATDPVVRARLAQVLGAAFAAWENPALRFDVTFDGEAVEGPGEGAEIDVFAVAESHPIFEGESFFGYTDVDHRHAASRLLTNGWTTRGAVILGADVYVNVDLVLGFAELAQLSLDQQADALQRLLMHEIGHAIGLHHPNDPWFDHFDRDDDPMDLEVVDPANPFAHFLTSGVRPLTGIMSNALASAEPLFYTSLENDDVVGRDVLYPAVPEPDAALLLGLAAPWLLRLAASRARRARATRDPAGPPLLSGAPPGD